MVNLISHSNFETNKKISDLYIEIIIIIMDKTKVISKRIISKKATKEVSKDEFKSYLTETGTTLILQLALAELYNDCVKSGKYNEDPLGFIADFITSKQNEADFCCSESKRIS